jgi:hypothetical protein
MTSVTEKNQESRTSSTWVETQHSGKTVIKFVLTRGQENRGPKTDHWICQLIELTGAPGQNSIKGGSGPPKELVVKGDREWGTILHQGPKKQATHSRESGVRQVFFLHLFALKTKMEEIMKPREVNHWMDLKPG